GADMVETSSAAAAAIPERTSRAIGVPRPWIPAAIVLTVGTVRNGGAARFTGWRDFARFGPARPDELDADPPGSRYCRLPRVHRRSTLAAGEDHGWAGYDPGR